MRVPHLVLTAVACLAFPTAASASHLLGYDFNEASGDALDNGAAPAANGVLTGGATRSTNTPSGTGFSLDLRDVSPNYAHVRATDPDKLDGLSALTLTTWLNLAAYPTTGDSNNARLIAKQAGGNFGGFNFSLNSGVNTGTVGPDNFKLGLFLGNNISSGFGDFGSGFSSADAGADNQWTFLAVTYDSALATDNTRFYVGGVGIPVTQLGAPVTLPQLTIESGAADFGVGFTAAAATADTSAEGYQDDVRVYGSALGLNALEAVRAANVPEPSSVALMGMAVALGLGARLRHGRVS